MKDIERRSVALFLAVVVGASAAFWLLGALFSGRRLLVPGLPVSALMFVAPAVAVLAALGPRRVWRAFAARRATLLGAVRRSLPWSPLMPAVVLATYPVQAWAGREMPPLTVDPVSAVLLLAAYLLSGLVEEVGWTWFLAPRLRRRWRQLWVGVAVGSLWSGLHAVPYVQAGNPLSWVWWQCVFSVVFRVVLVEAYALSGESLAAVVVTHATYNVAWSLYPTQGSHYSPAVTAALTAAVAVALGRLSRNGCRPSPLNLAASPEGTGRLRLPRRANVRSPRG